VQIVQWFASHPGVAGIWSLVAIATVTLIKTWPTLKKLAMDENATLRNDRREDYRGLRAEFEVMKLRNGIVERHCTAVDVRMGQLEFIIGMVLDELETVDVGNKVAKKAREMFGRLYPVPPITQELERLKESLDPLQSPIPPKPSDNPEGAKP